MANLNIFEKVRKKRVNKKGQIGDIIAVIVIIFSIAATLAVSKYVFSSVDVALTEGDLHSTESAQSMQDMSVSFSIFDGAIIFIVIGLTIGLVITSFLIPAHPIFLVVNIIGMIFLVFVGAILSNTYEELISADGIESTMNTYGSLEKTNFLMSKLPYICAFLVLISTIVMYSKGRAVG